MLKHSPLDEDEENENIIDYCQNDTENASDIESEELTELDDHILS